MNKKVILAIIILALFLFLLPRFYFNHLEYKNRQIFNQIEEARVKTNDSIEQRSGRSGGIKDTNEYYNLSIDVTTGLNNIKYQIDKHESVLNTQNRIAFLLPSKFKEYLKLKNEVFNNYYASLRKFKELKEYEGWIYDVFSRKDKFSQGMRDVGENIVKLDDVQKLADDYEYVKIDVELYFQKGFISKEFYDAIITDIDTNVRLYKLFKDLIGEKIDVQEFNTSLEKININYSSSTMIDMFGKSYDEVTTVKQTEWSDLYNQADELTFDALDFYDKNQLAYDPLNVIIAKFNKQYPKNLGVKNSDLSNSESVKADLDGDGKKEVLVLTNSATDDEKPTGLLTAYDESGKEIAKLFEGNPIPMPFSNSAKVYTLDKKSKKEFVSYDFIAGPHSSRTAFFGMSKLATGENSIISICFTKDIKEASDCLFWSGQVDTLVANDFDKDGVLEVVEMVDEYPKDGELTKEENDAITNVLSDDDKDVLVGMTRIPKREKGGRGNRVVWGIYSFNGEIFEQQLGTNYDKYYKLVKEYLDLELNYPTVMKKSELSKPSLEYNEFMKDFWTSGLN